MNNEESNSILPIPKYGRPLCIPENSIVNPIKIPPPRFLNFVHI